MKKIIFVLLPIWLTNSIVSSQEMNKPQPAHNYLIKYPNVRDFTLSADGSEAYFTIQNPLEELSIIVRVKLEKDRWSEPAMVSFSGHSRDLEPSLSPDGLRLYFSSNRPSDPKSKEPKDYDIWYVQRKDPNSIWSAPVNIGAPINSDKDEFFPCLTKSGNLYFTSERDGAPGKDDILVSMWKEGYTTPVSVGKTVNSPGLEFNAYIDPDERFMIYTGYARPEGMGSGDLYISKKDVEGNWGASKSLGPGINSKYMDYCPFVDLKTGTLYFTSRRSDISVHDFTSLKDFAKVTQQYENGFSRLYKVSIADLLK